MFIQEKRYLVLWKSQKNIAKAGLLKLSKWDKRIKVDYLLNALPIYYDCDAKCIIHYKLRGDQKSRKSEWNFSLAKNQVQYDFQIQTSGDIESIESCYLTLAGNYIIAGEREFINDLVFIKDSESSDSKGYNDESDRKANESDTLAEARNNEEKNTNAQIPKNAEMRMNTDKIKTDIANESDTDTAANQNVGDAEGEVRSSEMEEDSKGGNYLKIRDVEYIQDIQYLLKQDSKLAELYYNSFLLHGFYQYRHFVICPEFIGVPGNFYEREAIAAKMMGFPYFIEAEFLDNCQLGGSLRQELPGTGTFGYYLQNLGQNKKDSN